MIKRIIVMSFVLVVAVAVQMTPAATYTIDPVHSQVYFKVDHLMISTVRGEFSDYTANVEADPASKSVKAVNATIKIASIDTRNKKRDDHLRSPDFFDAANYPEMTFKSTKVSGSGDDITVLGDLTIRGKTKSVVLNGKFRGEVKDPWGNTKAGFVAVGKINRQDFGLTWSKTLETGGLVVGNEVEIGLEIEAAKTK